MACPVESETPTPPESLPDPNHKVDADRENGQSESESTGKTIIPYAISAPLREHNISGTVSLVTFALAVAIPFLLIAIAIRNPGYVPPDATLPVLLLVVMLPLVGIRFAIGGVTRDRRSASGWLGLVLNSGLLLLLLLLLATVSLRR